LAAEAAADTSPAIAQKQNGASSEDMNIVVGLEQFEQRLYFRFAVMRVRFASTVSCLSLPFI
jgi:hypothetical protein